jgi:hypothetical protein
VAKWVKRQSLRLRYKRIKNKMENSQIVCLKSCIAILCMYISWWKINRSNRVCSAFERVWEVGDFCLNKPWPQTMRGCFICSVSGKHHVSLFLCSALLNLYFRDMHNQLQTLLPHLYKLTTKLLKLKINYSMVTCAGQMINFIHFATFKRRC